MTKKILVMKGAVGTFMDDFNSMCKSHDREPLFIDPANQEEFMHAIRNNEVDIIMNTWQRAKNMGGFTNEMISEIGNTGVRAICHMGAGYDIVGDPHAWKAVGVQVSNCPNTAARDTADTAIFHMLGAMRNFHIFSSLLKQGQWKNVNGGDHEAVHPGISPAVATLGILGMGNIGRAIRDRAIPFGFKQIQYFQRHQLPPSDEKGMKYVGDIDEFLRSSDVIIIIVPHNKSTHHLLNRERLLNVVKPGVVIVNVARGPIIDEEALAEALRTGRVASVGLDVFEFEPKVNPELISNPRALLTPHMGTHTKYSWDQFELEISSNVRSVLETGKVISLVPEQYN